MQEIIVFVFIGLAAVYLLIKFLPGKKSGKCEKCDLSKDSEQERS